MKKVYILQHAYERPDGDEETKFIGVYSTNAHASETIVKLRSMPGFRDYPEGFHIDAYTVNEDHWMDGFGEKGKTA